MSHPIPKTMRALVYRGQNDLRLEEVPVPRISAGELLVRVAVCGICPTDLKKIQAGKLEAPRIFGHEISGTVVSIGRGLTSFSEGDRVALHHHVPCLRCRCCAHRAFAHCPQYLRTGTTAGFEPSGGGFADYVRVMPFVIPGVVKIPAGNTFEEGAMLEPVNTVLKAVERLNLLPRDRVLVVGQGPIGLLFTRLLKLRRAVVWASDYLPSRLAMGRRWGAKPWGKKNSENNPKNRVSGLDALVVTVPSNEAVEAGFRSVRPGGKILLFGHTERGMRAPIDLGQICRDEIDILGSYSSDFSLQSEVEKLVFSGKIAIKPLVTHRFSLSDALGGINLASHPTEQSLKVMVIAHEAAFTGEKRKIGKRLRL